MPPDKLKRQKPRQQKLTGKRVIEPAGFSDLSKLSEAMRVLIKRAYELTKIYRTPDGFDVCTPCCVTQAEEAALKSIQPAQMPEALICTYNQSAKSREQQKKEVAYLLPRILELTALGAYIHHSTELYLCRIGGVDPTAWSAAESQLLEDFALQYLKDEFSQASSRQEIVELDAVLIMLARTRINLDALFDYLTERTGFYEVASIANLLIQERDEAGNLNNPFCDDQLPFLNGQIKYWINKQRKTLRSHAEQAILHQQEFSGIYSPHIRYGLEQSLVELASL